MLHVVYMNGNMYIYIYIHSHAPINFWITGE